jgi:signal peptidase I
VSLVLGILVGLRIVFSVPSWVRGRQRVMQGLCDLFGSKATGPEAERSTLEFVDSGLMALALVFLIIRPFVVQAFYIPSGSMEPTLYGDQDKGGPPNDRILVNKFIYRFREPRRQDIVVFIAPDRVTNGERKDYIKRLIGLPGDLIEIRPGAVYVNGKPLDEQPYFSKGNPTNYYWPLVKIQGGRIYSRPNDFIEEFDGPAWPAEQWIGKSYKDMPEQLKGVWVEDSWADLPRDGPIRVPEDCYFVLGDNRNNSNDGHRWGFLKKERVLGKAMLTFWPPVRQDDDGRRRWNIRLLR